MIGARQWARTKVIEKPAYPPGINPQRLAAGSFVLTLAGLVLGTGFIHVQTDLDLFTAWY
jgi:hypothetical protein